ncbi:MAG: hypothetical protein OXC40_05270, partial [Proteobacteria bacterium]|nr:hypothetical protein [Pseudomonadota bacterium]
EDIWLALKPWLSNGHAVFVVWCPSNPSGGWLQDVVTGHWSPPHDPRLAQDIASEIISSFQRHNIISSLGFVLGATQINSLSQECVQVIQNLPLLIPGVGAQGGESSGFRYFREQPWQLWPVSRGLFTRNFHHQGGESFSLNELLSDNIAYYHHKLS